METLDQLKHTVREYVKIDNEMKALNNELKQRRKEKGDLSKKLVEVMRQNQLDIFDIKNGQIMYVKKSIKKPVSQKHLLTILSTYYENDVSEAKRMHQYIMDNRIETVSETIERRIDKEEST
jgi:hypothetical protein